MILVWDFKVNAMAETAEWENGVMRCTVSEVYDLVDQIIADGEKLPCGSATVMVEPTLSTEEGAYAVIAAALLEVADFQTIRPPQTDVTIGEDVFYSDANDIEKAKQSFGGDRSAAGRHAAQIRWGTKAPDFDPLSVKEMGTNEMEQYLDSLYPFPEDEDYPFTSAHEAAIKEYTDEGWAINGALRGQANEGVVIRPYSTVGQMDSAFDAAGPIDKAIVLHRGLDLKSFTEDGKATIAFFDGMKVGQSFSDPAFGSTTASSKVANEFGARSRIRMKIVCPEGSKVLPINTMLGTKHSYAGEKEVLLPRNTRMRLVKRQVGEWENMGGEGLTLTFVVEPTGGVQKAREKRFGSRSEAAQYAARVRWGNRGEETTGVDMRTLESDPEAIRAMKDSYPQNPEEVWSEDELMAVQSYVAGGTWINDGLRTGEIWSDEELRDDAYNLDSAIDKAPALPKALLVHRGIDRKTDTRVISSLKSLKVGESFSDDAFSSTSTSKKTAERFTDKVRIEIALPAGTKRALHLSVLGAGKYGFGESEVLLPRGAGFKVLANNIIDGVAVLRVTPLGGL